MEVIVLVAAPTITETYKTLLLPVQVWEIVNGLAEFPSDAKSNCITPGGDVILVEVERVVEEVLLVDEEVEWEIVVELDVVVVDDEVEVVLVVEEEVVVVDEDVEVVVVLVVDDDVVVVEEEVEWVVVVELEVVVVLEEVVEVVVIVVEVVVPLEVSDPVVIKLSGLFWLLYSAVSQSVEWLVAINWTSSATPLK